jgi:hypothetical protein
MHAPQGKLQRKARKKKPGNMGRTSKQSHPQPIAAEEPAPPASILKRCALLLTLAPSSQRLLCRDSCTHFRLSCLTPASPAAQLGSEDKGCKQGNVQKRNPEEGQEGATLEQHRHCRTLLLLLS